MQIPTKWIENIKDVSNGNYRRWVQLDNIQWRVNRVDGGDIEYDRGRSDVSDFEWLEENKQEEKDI